VLEGEYEGKPVAVKIALAEQQAYSDLLREEGDTLYNLQHPCLLRPHALVDEPGFCALVMPLYKDGSVYDALWERNRDPAVGVVLQANHVSNRQQHICGDMLSMDASCKIRLHHIGCNGVMIAAVCLMRPPVPQSACHHCFTHQLLPVLLALHTADPAEPRTARAHRAEGCACVGLAARTPPHTHGHQDPQPAV
jgi:hypothetical protein